MDRVRNEKIQHRTGVTMDLACRVDRKVLRWFEHMHGENGWGLFNKESDGSR